MVVQEEDYQLVVFLNYVDDSREGITDIIQKMLSYHHLVVVLVVVGVMFVL